MAKGGSGVTLWWSVHCSTRLYSLHWPEDTWLHFGNSFFFLQRGLKFGKFNITLESRMNNVHWTNIFPIFFRGKKVCLFSISYTWMYNEWLICGGPMCWLIIMLFANDAGSGWTTWEWGGRPPDRAATGTGSRHLSLHKFLIVAQH